LLLRGSASGETSIRSDAVAWDIIREFAATDMTLPETEKRLQEHLGGHYDDRDWQPALKAVMDAEGDVSVALEAIRKLSASTHLPRLTIKLPARPQLAPDAELSRIESELMDSVEELVQRRRIFRAPTLEELVNPIEEEEDEDSPYRFEGGDVEIIAQVRREMATEQEVIEVDDSESEEEDDPADNLSRAETIKLCQELEKMSIRFGGEDLSVDLPPQLRKFRAQLQRDELTNAKQVTLEQFFKPKE